MGTDANGWPTNVAANELIESAWGNGVVTAVRYALVGSGVNRIGPHIQAAIGTVLHTAVTPVLPYATRMIAQAAVWVGNDSIAIPGITAGILTQVGAGADQPSTPPVATPGAGGTYGLVSLVWSWVVPAGGSPQYACNAGWGGGGGGTMYTAADTTWQRYRS